jgi:large subunit ribosomal protein L21
MFAVIKTGGKQYKVAPNDVLRVEKLAGEPGDLVEFGAVLAIGGEAGVTLGAPLVEGAMVAAEVVEQGRADKIIVFKKKRRKNHRRRNGHRQHETVLRVTEILTDGKKPSKAASKAKVAKAEPAPEAEAAPAAEAAPKKAPADKAPAKKAAPKKAAPKKAAAKKAPAKKAAKKAAKKEE